MIDKAHYTATDEIVQLFNQNRAIYDEDCPSFINLARWVAFQKFQTNGIPSNKSEHYKYTDLRPVFQNDFTVIPRYINQLIDLHDLFRCDVPQLDTHLVLLINGWFYKENRKIGHLPDGVIVGSLKQVANENPELIKKFYNSLAGESFDSMVCLNTTFAKDGLSLFIPDNTIIEKPIQIINLMYAKDNAFAIQRNLFVMGKNSEATVVFCDHTLNHNYYIFNNLTECFLADNSRFNFYAIQNQHNGAVNNTHFFSQLEKSSSLYTNTLTLNGGLVRNNLLVKLNGEKASARLNGLTLADERQHVDNAITVEHCKANCISNQLYKNILDDESTGVFTGQIHVFSDAQKTEAYQKNNNVLLSTNAVMNTKPQLIIDADDVRCSHGATIGLIDEEALFYLRTRGIGEEEARLMIMVAFADEVISQIKVDALKDRIEELVNKRLRGDLSPCQHCSLSCR